MANTVIGLPMQPKEQRTKWMRFYLNIYLLLKLISVVLAIPSIFSVLPLIAEWVAEGYNLYAIALIAPIVVILSTIMTFIKTRKLTPSGYKWNTVMIWSNFVGLVAWSFLQEMSYRQAGAYTPPGFTFIAIILYLFGWTVPNLVYFHNRRRLFYIGTEEEKAAPAAPNAPDTLTPPIRKPCHYKPGKAKVDTRKLYSPKNRATKFARIIKHRQLR